MMKAIIRCVPSETLSISFIILLILRQSQVMMSLLKGLLPLILVLFLLHPFSTSLSPLPMYCPTNYLDIDSFKFLVKCP